MAAKAKAPKSQDKDSKKKQDKLASAEEARENEIARLLGQVNPRKITEEMQESYLDYAMSVIVARALPDVRDGLKPVHRRILHVMNQLGLTSGAKFKKSANVVGEVLGKYHPHGDTAVYDAMVRMAQEFSMRYPLVRGQGNFGSVDGDRAAAMRYTEAKMAKITDEMMADIEKQTVDFSPNYDGSLKEPKVLPSRLPQLLLNGAVGIAVGMATEIPPHNLTELCDGITHLIDHPDAEVEDLMEFVKGPDFPTGGQIYDQKEILSAYATGKGAVVMRGKAEIVEVKEGSFHIIVTEIPYQVNKADLITKIAELVREKKLDGIRDLRDESDRDGIRVVIELKKDAYPNKVLNSLYKMTTLQTTFHLNMLALVDGIQPRVLTLKNILEEFIKHRQVVITRRTQYDLDRARERAHILEGLKKALDHINEIISTIKKSPTKEEAHKNLIRKFRFSDRQAAAILEMRLSTLAGLERKKIEDELKEKRRLIKELEDILRSPKKILGIVRQETQEIKEKFGDERRTKIFKQAVGKLETEDLIPDEDVVISLSRDGYVKRMPPDAYRVQHRGGKGVKGATIKEEDAVENFFTARTLSNIFFFTNLGRVFVIKGWELPETSRIAKGQAIVNFLQLGQSERVEAAFALGKDFKTESGYFIMATKNGVIKKSPINEFENVRRSGLIAIKIKPGDELMEVRKTSGKDEVFVATANGQAIHFEESDVREMGRNAAGVRGIKLKNKDFLIGLDVIDPKAGKQAGVLTITEKGYGKITPLNLYKIQNRGGSGIRNLKVTTKNGPTIAMFMLDQERAKKDLVVISKKGQIIRTPISDISKLGRDSQGVKVMRMDAGDSAASATIV